MEDYNFIDECELTDEQIEELLQEIKIEEEKEVSIFEEKQAPVLKEETTQTDTTVEKDEQIEFDELDEWV